MKNIFWAAALAGLMTVSCAMTDKDPGAKGSKWRLAWSDEFDKDGAPDPEKWSHESGFVRNGELQFYTEKRPENVRVENGVLVIEARKEEWPNPNFKEGSKDRTLSRKHAAYTSGSIHTKGKAEWTYGRIEVRLKVPKGRGTWPAAWMLGSNIGQAGWPLCGEIDLMENVGYDLDKMHFNVHTKAYHHSIGTNKGASLPLKNPDQAFHIFAAEWTKERIDFFLDGRPAFSFKNEGTGVEAWPFDKPQYLILNLAIGGGWGGQKGVDDAIFPARYLVDYVRVYQASQP